ncbi:MAG: tetratricopeptide repeat protein [Alphaproteobacteria bacterium]|nr:tetratricopeptide repeat protein [Alphaproteobacteria bacterium]
MSRSIALALALAAVPAAAAPALPAELRSRASALPAVAGDVAAALDEGRALLAAANPVQAIAAFNAALAQDPANLAALNGLGIAYDRLGRADLARQMFERALSLAPDAFDIAYNLGWSLLQAGQERAAIAPLQQAMAGSDPRAAAAARRALALVAARLASPAAPPPAVAPAGLARIDLVASGEAVLVLAEPPRPAATPAPRLAAAVAAVETELAARLGSAAALTRPPEAPAPLAAALPAALPAADTPSPPPSRPAPPRPAPLPLPAALRPHPEPALPVAVLAQAVAPARPRSALLVMPRRAPDAEPLPLSPPPPADPAADIRLAIARLERLIARIEAARA